MGEEPSTGADVVATARVLIVDDEPANVALLTRVIRAAGISQVHAVTDPGQAVRRCQEVDADLVLLDLHMPGVDGFTLMAQLQAAVPEEGFLPILVLTADTTASSRDRALRAGAKDFLTKPFDTTEVVLRVRNLLETGSLYASLRQRNADLRTDLASREAEERRLADHRQRQSERVQSVLQGDALRTVFQQIAHLGDGRVVGLEALSRFDVDPYRPPDEWFDEATAVGRGAELEIAAIRAALSHLPQLPPEAFLSVNVSPATAVRPELAQVLDGHPLQRVVLELTEHVPVDDYQVMLAALDPLRAAGMRVAVDDAGAGYSGLQHILHLRPDIIKLDTGLTRSIDSDPPKRALATALVAFAAEIDATIIAEGVETAGELATLRSLGVAWGQGYHLARPGELPLACHTVL